jgi:adenosylcobinamide-GDP ribazoletransferase
VIGRELRLLLCAVQFLTRLPTPQLVDWREDWLARSAKYFPLVGMLVGAISAAVYLASGQIWPGGPLPALLAIGVGIAVTGAFHEDGLADTADGLGGGQDREARLAIMKDSRLGTYGALALGLGLALKVAALATLQPTLAAAAVLLGAHSLGRGVAVVAMAALPYAADPAASKLKPTPRDVRGWEAGVALVIGAAPLLILTPVAALTCAGVGCLAALWPALAARQLIRGQTGDVLGAIEQAFEIGFLLAAAGLWALGIPLR